jgi:hypothetical protein
MKVISTLLVLILVSTINQAQYKPISVSKIAFREKPADTMSYSRYVYNVNRYRDTEVSGEEKNSEAGAKTLPLENVSQGNYTTESDSTSAEIIYSDTINTALTDTMKYNMYGDLLNDNLEYNPKSSIGMVVLRVSLANLTTNLVDHYGFAYDFSRVGFNSWNHNIKTGWEWDNDRFAMNNFFHPFSGGMFFNGARANGYSFFESVPFAFLGSFEWEYFGETTLPSYNDFINTPINGAFLGEIFYRLGSNILDDQTSGANRFIREFAVAVMTPTRFFSRLLTGKVWRTTTEEVYQKEPLNITMQMGYHRINEGTNIQLATNSLNMNLNLDYGNPFEKRSRKPYDYYRVRADIDFGVGRKMIDNVMGFGILTGRNLQVGSTEVLAGIFQHMSYFDNKTFELATIGFGTGVIVKQLLTKATSLYTDLHVNFVPFGSLSGRYVTDTSEIRDYNYGGGAEIKFESTIKLYESVGLTFAGYYWWFHTYVGTKGNSYIGIIKPRITVKLYKGISVGGEYLVYYADRYPSGFGSVHDVRTEQKIFFQIAIEDFQFRK